MTLTLSLFTYTYNISHTDLRGKIITQMKLLIKGGRMGKSVSDEMRLK